MDERMKGRRMIQIDSIEMAMRGNDIRGNWVTIGVVVEKTETRQASNGKKFIIFRMSRLNECTVNVFLWDEAYSAFCKESI
jgi:hypothetical protein